MAESLRENKTGLLSVVMVVVMAIGGYAVGKIESSSTNEQRLKTIEENYVSKDKFDNLKESLQEIKNELKEIRKDIKNK